MTVRELKKINEYAKNNDFLLDYEDLLRLSIKDINRIIAFIDVDNSKVESVIDFMCWELNNPNWLDVFNHMKGIESFDIREYLIVKMITAKSQCISKLILAEFDFGADSKLLKSFNTIEEWKTYVENIDEAMEGNRDLVISNLSLILKKVTDDRCDSIEQVMSYSQNKFFEQKYLKEYLEKNDFESYISEILPLLAKGYNTDAVFTLFANWIGDLITEDVTDDVINYGYQNVISYLKESKLFDYLKDDYSLVNIFNQADYGEDYKDIILLLKEIEEEEDKELFEYCLDNYFLLNHKNIRDYIRKILYAKEENNDYRKSLLYLLDKETIASENFCESEDNISRAWNALIMCKEQDNTSMEMAEFITNIRYPAIIKDMIIRNNNYDTRKILYNNFPKFIIGSSLLSNQIEYYADWLKKLSQLPSDICQKVIDIINISLIKNMDIEQQKEIKELILNPENFGSLEYIYSKYKEKEEEYNRYHSTKNDNQSVPSYDPEVKLITVVELLEAEFDIDTVLDGFEEDAEITPKTLIRSLAYKNNQK